VGARVEPLVSAADAAASVTLEVRNWAGPKHARLITVGEDELNYGARRGERPCGDATPTAGVGSFRHAVDAAEVLGGTLRLVLSADEVVARLELPRVPFTAPAADVPSDIAALAVAVVDDSPIQRKLLAKLVRTAFPRCHEPIVAGDTFDSIDGFARTAVDADTDVCLVDQNFGLVNHNKCGTDLVREIRLLDAARLPRLVFVVSANDSPDDVKLYLSAGADGHIRKNTSPTQLRKLLCDRARDHPRFTGRVS